MPLQNFLKAVLSNPLRMGAVLPSSQKLADSMISYARIDDGHIVVELGAGNGALTREIIARHPGNPLFAFEISTRLGGELASRFPSAKVVLASAEELPLVAPALGLGLIDRIVSGLPWALWSEGRQAAILDGLLPMLAPEARMVTFHYAHSRFFGRVEITRRLLQQRFFDVSSGEVVWANLPPAFVHVAEIPRVCRHARPSLRTCAEVK